MEDQIILEKLKDSSRQEDGFELLVRKYQERLYWHIRKMVIDHDDADDILQDVFIKVWKNIGNFREDSQLYTWLYRIASNECLNFLKRKKRRNMFSFRDTSDELLESIEGSENIDGSEVQLKLQKAILQLPDKQRMVFNLKYFDELKYEDISKITETSIGGLKASYHLAVKKIEEFLNTH